MADDVRQRALSLLELINERAGGRTDIEVWPDDQMAAGLGYRGSRHYDTAIRLLLSQDYLQIAETNALISGLPEPRLTAMSSISRSADKNCCGDAAEFPSKLLVGNSVNKDLVILFGLKAAPHGEVRATLLTLFLSVFQHPLMWP